MMAEPSKVYQLLECTYSLCFYLYRRLSPTFRSEPPGVMPPKLQARFKLEWPHVTLGFRERCKFTHDRDTSASPRASPLPTQLSTPTQSRRQGTPAASRAPRQVCDFFWTTGQCARGFECNFRHERQHGAGPAQDQPATAPSEEQAADFFSAEGLAINIGSVREERHTLNPSEVHNHLKEFLRDNYTFESASKVQGFVRILGSVNDRNKAWNTEDAQALLEVIVKGNILLRIGDVLRFEPVDFRVSYGSGALSFQRGYFPVFQFFASDLILKTTLHKHINHLYTVLENNHEVVFNVIRICMAAMIENSSWKDPTPGLLPSLQNNLDGVTVFKVLSTIILQYLNRFKDSVRNHPNIVELVNKFSSWFELWEKAVSTSPPRFDDVITSSPHNTRILIIGQLREEIDRLKAIVQRESDTLRKLTRPSARPLVTPAQRSEALMGQLVQTYDPPGTLRTAGPRHDNDFEDISKIRIAPSHNELLSPLPPYLPVFLPNAPHHRPANSMERHVDIQFVF
ncbi:hypothetical protein A0H81_14503 [Grifola frondosa]|uniref:C3H1-type domain-containing protein n=1 Tax=Grifola frondosa TaxID=5627 RepID=A0A1C7LL98_GRIFR|nr:hypothetical protein A0H81_14503 [Grifola frondosa]